MDTKQAASLNAAAEKEIAATRRFIRHFNEQKTGNDIAAFDSMLVAIGNGNRESGMTELPSSLQHIFKNPNIGDNKQPIFDGIEDGIAEYKRRNGGDEPPAHAIAAGLSMAACALGNLENQSSSEREYTFDSLSFSHHEALSVVPGAVQVLISYGIATNLPLVVMLPNPTGSNELPIVFGEAVADIDMGVMRRGELIDGAHAGMPYLENRHTLTMEKGLSGAFSLESHVAYDAETRANGTVKFVVDKSSLAAPFLGGRVVVKVKGVEVANDKHYDHATFSGISTLQARNAIEIGADKFKVKSATANLDTHKVDVQFDLTGGNADPAADDVTVDLIFDYEREDAQGNPILRAPGVDMRFMHRSLYAYPSRSRSKATIDAITQMENELGLNWFAAAQTISMQRYFFEQTSRLLRDAVNYCQANQDTRVVTFDFTTAGVSPTNIADAVSKINITLGNGRTRLSREINLAIAGYDLYVSARGAAFFSALGGENYEPTNEPYGDQYSVYRIGRLKNTGANVYFVPESMGVFHESASDTTAHALMVARSLQPMQAPFVGMVAVPPIVLTSNKDAFTKDVATYSRMAADVNPIDKFAGQFILIEMINLPAL